MTEGLQGFFCLTVPNTCRHDVSWYENTLARWRWSNLMPGRKWLGCRKVPVASTRAALPLTQGSRNIHNRYPCRSLTPRTQNYKHPRVVGSDSSLYQKLHEIAVRKIFPILDRYFSNRNLSDLTPPYIATNAILLGVGSPQSGAL